MTLPQTMHFIDLPTPGGPEAMVLGTGPLPTPGAADVLIRVLAAGVNRPDVFQRAGAYPPPPGASPILGLEVAGEVVAAGEAVTQWRVGDRVCGLANGGGYAGYCAVPATQCLPWPIGYDALQAAALPENFFTVWANLFQLGGLTEGHTTLIHGGTSGIGITALQLARERGAKVYVTAGSADKCAACVRLGADAAIDHRSQDFVAEVRRLTEKRGVDVILDMVGGPYIQRNIQCLAMDGKLVQIAFLQGATVEKFDFNQVMLRRLTITGSTMRPRSAANKGAIAGELRAQVWPVLDQGRCAPVIHAVFPLAQAAEAHRLMESSAHIGKIMLQVA